MSENRILKIMNVILIIVLVISMIIFNKTKKQNDEYHLIVENQNNLIQILERTCYE